MSGIYEFYTEDEMMALLEKRDKELSNLEHILAHRTNQLKISKKHWIRAAKKALAGNTKELRSRIELAEDTSPFKIVHSKGTRQ